MSTRVLIDRSLDHLSKCLNSLVRTDLIYKLLAFCLFSPVFSLLLGYALALSGNRVLTDLDIVHFIAGPLGHRKPRSDEPHRATADRACSDAAGGQKANFRRTLGLSKQKQ